MITRVCVYNSTRICILLPRLVIKRVHNYFLDMHAYTNAPSTQENNNHNYSSKRVMKGLRY